MMNDSGIWFSYKQKRYEAKEIPNTQKKIFDWTKKEEIWDWNNCEISVVKTKDNKIRVVARRVKKLKRSQTTFGDTVRLMLGVEISGFEKAKPDNYHEPPPHNKKNKVYGDKKPRWFIKLHPIHREDSEGNLSECEIWQWGEKNSMPEGLKKIMNDLELKTKTSKTNPGIFEVGVEPDERIIPVIYQPDVDGWANFLRRVHWEWDDDLNLTLVFQDEELRRLWIFDNIYRWFRRHWYGRIKDIESFKIILKNKTPRFFKFEGIYSGEQNNIKKDDVHENRSWGGLVSVPPHEIKYYFDSLQHPIVFVNTSNHALAHRDNNHNLWKWEYVPWETNTPIITGEKSRKKVEDEIKKEAKKEKR